MAARAMFRSAQAGGVVRLPCLPSTEVWNAGAEGEERVAEVLADLFVTDDWTLVSGYKNQGGEIDKILVGPEGILAIEIKYVNGVVSCHRDRWCRDKYDRYGNLVETDVPIADKRGRGPSAQVNDAADRLQAFLSKRGCATRVHRAVVLSHPASELGEIRDQTVDLIATVDELTLAEIGDVLDDDGEVLDVRRVVELLRKDHAFHQGRPPQRQRRRQSAAA